MVTTRAPLGVVGFLSYHVCLTTRISLGFVCGISMVSSVFLFYFMCVYVYMCIYICMFFFFFLINLFNFTFIDFSLVILFTVGFGLMGKKKKREKEQSCLMVSLCSVL